MPVDKFGRMSDAKTRDTGVSLTYFNNNYIRSDGGTPVSGSIDMRGNTLYNVPDPVNPQDVATKEYADKVGGGKVAIVKMRDENYGALGNIDMQGYTLTNVLDPAEAQDVATKEYADKMVNNVGKYVDEKNAYIKREVDEFTKLLDHVKRTIDERPHIIVAHASYHGDLKKGEYDFNFRGSNSPHYNKHDAFNRFLMPHSGYIKRFVLEDTGHKFYTHEDLTFDDFLIKHPGDYDPLPIFSPVVIKNNFMAGSSETETFEMVELGTLNIHIKPSFSGITQPYPATRLLPILI